MKKSTTVTLLISGALLAGCDGYDGSQSSYDNNPPLTNNTYVAGQGYWHAPYRGWYPFPYNSYSPSLGYYHGGTYSEMPEVSEVTSSSPSRGASGFGFAGDGSANGGRSSVSRGGFGGSARGGS